MKIISAVSKKLKNSNRLLDLTIGICLFYKILGKCYKMLKTKRRLYTYKSYYYYKPNGKRLSQAKLFTVYYISALTCMCDS